MDRTDTFAAVVAIVDVLDNTADGTDLLPDLLTELADNVVIELAYAVSSRHDIGPVGARAVAAASVAAFARILLAASHQGTP